MVATDMGAAGLDAMAKLQPELDTSSFKLLSVEDSVNALKRVVCYPL